MGNEICDYITHEEASNTEWNLNKYGLVFLFIFINNIVLFFREKINYNVIINYFFIIGIFTVREVYDKIFTKINQTSIADIIFLIGSFLFCNLVLIPFIRKYRNENSINKRVN